MSTQDEIFATEGDKWFQRNNYETGEENEIINYLKGQSDFLPKNILDIGCSNGKKLNQIHGFYQGNAECYGLEPSALAIEDGQKQFTELKLSQGFSHDLKMLKDGYFDLVIMSFVWHWIDRKKLYLSMSEIDRVLKERGRLIILDFAPPYPCKTEYHHLPEEEVFTYKQPYWQIFSVSQLYSLIFLKEFQHNKKPELENRNLCQLAVLEKRTENNYLLV